MSAQFAPQLEVGLIAGFIRGGGEREIVRECGIVRGRQISFRLILMRLAGVAFF